MEKIQQEFEEWLKSCGNLTMKEDDGQYSFQHTRFAFEAWKASRAALCVELPTKMSDEVLSLYDIGLNDGIDGATECIEGAGVSYK